MKKTNLPLTTVIVFSLIAVVLLTLSLIVPNNIFFLPFAVICSAISILANGVKQLKDKNKARGILNIVVSIFMVIIGVFNLLLKLSIMSNF